jgi:cell division septation protein DedD
VIVWGVQLTIPVAVVRGGNVPRLRGRSTHGVSTATVDRPRMTSTNLPNPPQGSSSAASRPPTAPSLTAGNQSTAKQAKPGAMQSVYG